MQPNILHGLKSFNVMNKTSKNVQPSLKKGCCFYFFSTNWVLCLGEGAKRTPLERCAWQNVINQSHSEWAALSSCSDGQIHNPATVAWTAETEAHRDMTFHTGTTGARAWELTSDATLIHHQQPKMDFMLCIRKKCAQAWMCIVSQGN